MRILALDLEFDRMLPPTWSREPTAEARSANERDVRVTCASVIAFDGARWQTRLYHRDAPAPLERADCDALVEDLYLATARDGFLVVTWGGAAGDFRVLHANCSFAARPKLLQVLWDAHVDIPLVASAFSGCMPGLRATMHVYNPLVAKAPEASASAPLLWARGLAATVLSHVQLDAWNTAQVYTSALRGNGAARERAVVYYETRAGRVVSWTAPRIGGRLPTVRECQAHVRSHGSRAAPPLDVASCVRWVPCSADPHSTTSTTRTASPAEARDSRDAAAGSRGDSGGDSRGDTSATEAARSPRPRRRGPRVPRGPTGAGAVPAARAPRKRRSPAEADPTKRRRRADTHTA